MPGPSYEGLFQNAPALLGDQVPTVIGAALAVPLHVPQTMLRARTIKRRAVRFIGAAIKCKSHAHLSRCDDAVLDARAAHAVTSVKSPVTAIETRLVVAHDA